MSAFLNASTYNHDLTLCFPTGQTTIVPQDAGHPNVWAHGFPEAIALRVATLLQPPPPADPFANLKALEEVAQRVWLLSASQLAPLLGLKTLTGQTIHRYGFTCKRQGRNGMESA